MYRKVSWIICVMWLMVIMIACSEKKESAVTGAGPLRVFKQEISSPSQLQTLKVDQEVTMDIIVKNVGNEPWPNKGTGAKGSNIVGLGYHWIDIADIEMQEGRTLLPSELLPGASVNLNVKIQAPPEPGKYKLRFSMVQEHVAWFYNMGAQPYVVNVIVKK